MVGIYEKYNCSAPETHRPDAVYADISGIGVVIAFIITAYMVIVLGTIDYLLAFGQSTPSSSQVTSGILVNQIDAGVVVPIQAFLRWAFPLLFQDNRLAEIRDILHSFIMALSDMQTCTGILILTAGAIVMLTTTLSQYHWEIVVLMAWLCHVSNMSAMASFRSALQDQVLRRYWRIGLGTVLTLMLFMSNIPTGFWYNEVPYARHTHYAICAITVERMKQVIHYLPISYDVNDESDGAGALEQFITFVASSVIICLAYVVRIMKLSVHLSQRASEIQTACAVSFAAVISRFDGSVQKMESGWFQHYLIHCARPSLEALQFSAGLHCDFVASMLSELLFAYFSVIWVTRRIGNLRGNIWSDGPQNTWTFGQILPMALLLYPLLSLTESILLVIFRTVPSTVHNPQIESAIEDERLHYPDNGSSMTIERSRLNPVLDIYTIHHHNLNFDWRYRVRLQFLFQLLLIFLNSLLVVDANALSMFFYSFDTVIFLHPFAIYFSTLLHIQADALLPAISAASSDASDNRRKSGLLFSAVFGLVSFLFYVTPVLVNTLRTHSPDGILFGWHFPIIGFLYFGGWWLLFFQVTAISLSCMMACMGLYHIIWCGLSKWKYSRHSIRHDLQDLHDNAWIES